MTVFNRVIDRVASDEAYLEETLQAAARCGGCALAGLPRGGGPG